MCVVELFHINWSTAGVQILSSVYVHHAAVHLIVKQTKTLLDHSTIIVLFQPCFNLRVLNNNSMNPTLYFELFLSTLYLELFLSCFLSFICLLFYIWTTAPPLPSFSVTIKPTQEILYIYMELFNEHKLVLDKCHCLMQSFTVREIIVKFSIIYYRASGPLDWTREVAVLIKYSVGFSLLGLFCVDKLEHYKGTLL